jgi:hypothetical protein
LRPDLSFRRSFRDALGKGVASAQESWTVMVALLAAMSALVAVYYSWPPGAALLCWYAAWQRSGGFLLTGLAAGFAGGILSEASVVYIVDGGRWNARHVENMVFRFLAFFFGGIVVAEFYEWQAYWFGVGVSWRVIVPKVLVDQFIFSVFWSTTYQTLLFRWQALRYSGSRLWSELDGRFVMERMLPILVTNWLFWIPGVTLVYSMPLNLQMPLNIFAMAIWSLLLAGLSKPAPDTPAPALAPGPMLTPSNSLADLAE